MRKFIFSSFVSKKNTLIKKFKLLKNVSFFSTVFFILFINITSCSLSYQQEQKTETVQEPEFTFRNSEFKRYEDNKLKLNLTSTRMEQYQDITSTFAKDANFKLRDQDEKIQTQGSCQLMSIDSTRKDFFMFNQIQIQSEEKQRELSAESLHWNGTSEQLVSAKDGEVHIIQEKIEVTGKDFAFDGVTKEFSFGKSVKGTIETDD